MYFFPSCYLAELGQLSLRPNNSQRQSGSDGCGLGPVHSRCICGGLIRTSTARTRREHSREKERGGQGGGQRYKPDQPFSSSAHKYLCGSYINSRPEEEIKVKCMKLRLLPDAGCTPRSYLLNIKLHLRPVLAGVAPVPKLSIPPGVSRSASRSLTAKSQPRSAQTLVQKNQPVPRPTCVLDR